MIFFFNLISALETQIFIIMSKNNKIIKLIDLGIKSYEETLSIQENFFIETIETKKRAPA